jgi:glycogen debranching enzyme
MATAGSIRLEPPAHVRVPVPPSAYADLEKVRAAEGGLYGSAGDLFADAVFGRDSIVCAEDLLHIRPDVAEEVIFSLARLQGTVDAPIGLHSNEEEVGKIHHEHRSLYVGERRISKRSQQLLELLSSMWGGDGQTLTYYGSADATPLYVRLVCHFCAAHGPEILDRTLTDRSGSTVTVRQSVEAALGWIVAHIENSDLGLLENTRRNIPHGHPFQAWKDSGTSYIHRDGSLADYSQPIAIVEIQGYAYDALTAAAKLLRQPDWVDLAKSLRRQTLCHLWMDADRFFAMGTDRDAAGATRQIDSIASNGALLLNSTIFDGLVDARHYIEGVARRICGPDFVTDVGIRCRSLSEDGLVDFQDYHGTWTNWQKDGFDVAQGLRRQGFQRLGRQLEIRLLNGVNVAGANVEFLYVSPDGRVQYDFGDRNPLSDHPQEIRGTNRPESLQAWTVTAMMAIKAGRRALAPAPDWVARVEDEILGCIPHAAPLRTQTERQAVYDRRGDFVLNMPGGFEHDQAARARSAGHEL